MGKILTFGLTTGVQIIIPIEPTHDQLLRKHLDTGDLHLSDAYNFKLHHLQELQWTKVIWSPDIPPSKSFLVWRMMHNKFTSMEDMWKLCDMNWSPQCKITITAALVNLINSLWYARNQARFHNNHIDCKSVITMIIANTSLSGNNSKKVSSNSIRDFTILKNFNVSTHHSTNTMIKEVLWQPPLINWLKCNIDGAAKGNHGLASCGGIFRNHVADMIYCFAEPLGTASAFQVELCGAMRAIEVAHNRNWKNIWL
ncbi:hypothetical protein TSUD_287810 [Trifolium subterraneum]|uniref:Uncharacterized protein n=1 Tax=Trifolium subterraneum TaxID=3900 RepID=A0A2Z6NFS7_TRISU|nr:hypothetical protein TSUD_287810 [Trifolium subterraneum]